jgi:hypothetical protein
MLVMGPKPKCYKFSKVKIGSVFYRTRDGDKGKRRTQCFVRAMFPKTGDDTDEEWEDRYDLNREVACFIVFRISLQYVCNMSAIYCKHMESV